MVMYYFSEEQRDRDLLERIARIANEREVFTSDEYFVLQHRLPFDGVEYLPIENLAKRMNITPFRVSKLQDRAAKKLRYYTNHPELYQNDNKTEV